MKMEEAIRWYAEQQLKKTKNPIYKVLAAQADDAIKRWEQRTKKIKEQEQREQQQLQAERMKRIAELEKQAEASIWADVASPNTTQTLSAAGVAYPGSNDYYGSYGDAEPSTPYVQLKAENESLMRKLKELEKGKESMTKPMEEILKTSRKFNLKGG